MNALELPPNHRHLSNEDYLRQSRAFLESLDEERQAQVKTWFTIGNENPWIRNANDPPFDLLSFSICKDVHDLAEQILHGNYCLGQAFVLGDICFINQLNGGDEWLTIKGNTSFESITMQTWQESREEAEARLHKTISRIQAATEEQCRQLDY